MHEVFRKQRQYSLPFSPMNEAVFLIMLLVACLGTSWNRCQKYKLIKSKNNILCQHSVHGSRSMFQTWNECLWQNVAKIWNCQSQRPQFILLDLNVSHCKEYSYDNLQEMNILDVCWCCWDARAQENKKFYSATYLH